MTRRPPIAAAPEVLLAQSAWVLNLARRLVDDPEAAEDLAQDAWRRALEAPPRADWPVRAWLAGILRNLARQERRERSRREAREQSAARHEALPSAADALERVQLLRGVVEAVLALEEPYRSTIVLRFYENLAPRKIAARDGIPVATVKTRLARGLAMLRARLDREHGGDGRSGALVLLPLATRGRGLGPLVAGALTVNTILKVSVASVVVIGAIFLATRADEPSPRSPAEKQVSASYELFAPENPPATPELVSPRETVETPPATRSEEEEPSAQSETIIGRVIDVGGVPVAGVELGLRSASGSRLDAENDPTFGSTVWAEELHTEAEPLAVSGGDGRFVLDRSPNVWGRIVSQNEEWETVLAPFGRARAGAEQTVVVAPRFRLSGCVRDDAGRPLANVELRFGVPRERLSCAGADLEDTLAGNWEAVSAADGRFSFERLPVVAGARLRAHLDGYRNETLERELWADDELELVLVRPEGARLEGVVEAGGEPVAGASVALGTRATTSDEHGAFQILLAGLEREQTLCAAAAGFLPVRRRGEPNADGSMRWPAFVRLELSDEPLTLEGRVVDAEGQPLAKQQVWLQEGRTVWEGRGGFPFLLESVAAGEPGSRVGTTTDFSGRFRIEGLEPHGYHLRVVDPRTALISDHGPFEAGSRDLSLCQPTDQLWSTVAGVVLSRGDDPIAGVRVSVKRSVDQVGVGSFFIGSQASGAQADTDAYGMFELHDVPRNGVQLSAWSEETVDPAFALTGDVDPLDVCLVVDRWVQLDVQVGSVYPDVRSFSLLDASGEAVQLRIPRSGGTSYLYRQDLVEGRSPVIGAGDQATTIVLHGEREELIRLPVSLKVGELNRIVL